MPSVAEITSYCIDQSQDVQHQPKRVVVALYIEREVEPLSDLLPEGLSIVFRSFSESLAKLVAQLKFQRR
jgi:hypothetical protein